MLVITSWLVKTNGSQHNHSQPGTHRVQSHRLDPYSQILVANRGKNRLETVQTRVQQEMVPRPGNESRDSIYQLWEEAVIKAGHAMLQLGEGKQNQETVHQRI